MNEIWKDIKGYEGHYMVSNTGLIVSLKQKKLLVFDNSHRYYRVLLCKDGKRQRVCVHRVVAETFIPNPENKPEVNHIDQNPLNNHVSNLEWVTHQENVQSFINSEKFKTIIEKRKAEKE